MLIQTLKAQRRNKKNQYTSYKRRYNALVSIISNLDSRLDDNTRRINDNIIASENGIKSGMKGNRLYLCMNEMENKKESPTYIDSSLYNCRLNIENERNRCLRKMNDLEWEIKQLEIKIRSQGGTIYSWE